MNVLVDLMIKSVLKAIKILELFEPNQPRMTVTEISLSLGIPKSTAHNLLNTLLSAGYIEQVVNDEYALGTAVIALTQNVRINVELRDRGAPLLRKLADDCNESVYLTVFNDDHVLYIYAVESSQRLLARTAVGDRVHMHCTSVGKVILGYLPDDKVDDILKRVGLDVYTANTIVDIETLKAELELTYQRGYSIDNQEHELDTYCIGAPIFDSSGEIIASCSVSGTDPQIIADRLPAIVQMVTRVGLAISQRMGYVPAKLNMLSRLDNR